MRRRAFLAMATGFAATFAAGIARADVLIVNSPRDGHLNLRSGPGTGFGILYAMPHGSEVHSLEWSGRWVRVRHESGRTGWCSAQYLARTGPERLYVYSANDGYLNLRTGPGTNHPIIMQMHNDEYVEELNRTGNWRKVRHQSGAIGWAHGRYLVN